MTIDRNAYGRQVDSFETELDAASLQDPERPFHAVFIRAPRIRAVADDVEVVMTLPAAAGGGGSEPVAVRRGSLFATTFHPELTDDVRLHAYFMQHCVAASLGATLPTTPPTTSAAVPAEGGAS